MTRDKRLLIAIFMFIGSSLAALYQSLTVKAYVYAAVMGNWADFARWHGVEPPAEHCLDFCAPELPFWAGWIGIGGFVLGLSLLGLAWWKPKA